MRRSRRQARAAGYKKPRARLSLFNTEGLSHLAGLLSSPSTNNTLSPSAGYSVECLEDRRMLAPVANPDYVVTVMNQSVPLQVLVNDEGNGVALDPASITFLSQPLNGSITTNPINGIVTYQPDAGFIGNDTFIYTVRDVNGDISNPTTGSISVVIPGQGPIAFDDYAVTSSNEPIEIRILDNDISPSSPLNPASIEIVAQPGIGTITVNRLTGIITYNPPNQGGGVTAFQYRVTNMNGVTSNTATVGIGVYPTQGAVPILTADFMGTLQGFPSAWQDLMANDVHPYNNLNRETLQLRSPAGVVEGPFTEPTTFANNFIETLHGRVYVAIDVENVEDYNVEYVPNNPQFVGTDYFYYRASNDNEAPFGGYSAWTRVDVIIGRTNQLPIAQSFSRNMNENTTAFIDVASLASDSDGFIVPLATQIEAAFYGNNPADSAMSNVIVHPQSGYLMVTPRADYTGTLTIRYTVADNQGARSEPATLVVNVLNVPDPPTAVNDSVTTPEDTPININVLSNDTDPDGDLDPCHYSTR